MRWRLLLVCLFALGGCDPSAPQPDELRVADILGGADDPGFKRAAEIRSFHFPEDHGPHPDYRNEWWYLTGNLQAEDGSAFGFQATFFRVALRAEKVSSPSAWRTNQVWMAHAALTDLSTGVHLADERFARQGVGLAGAHADPFRVWLEDWQLAAVGDDGVWHLRLPANGFELDLTLVPRSPVILQGERGLSQKSAAAGNASYYYSIPRLQARGRIRQARDSVAVEGLAWLDREWSTSALGSEQVGWDWFSLQLEDGRNLMFYQLRLKNGGVDPHSGGSVSDAKGLRRRLSSDQVSLIPLSVWHGYPIEWRMQVQGEPHPWRVRALLDDQEMRVSVRYWEGAVEVLDEADHALLGRGYLELAGYSGHGDPGLGKGSGDTP